MAPTWSEETRIVADEEAVAPLAARILTTIVKLPVVAYLWVGPVHLAPSAVAASGPLPSP